MILDKIKITDEERQALDELDQEINETIKKFSGTLPDVNEESQLTLEHYTQNEVFQKLMSLEDMRRIQQITIQERHMEELGSAENILKEAVEIILAIEKEDFQDYVRKIRKLLDGEVKKEKDVITINGKEYKGVATAGTRRMKHELYSYNFESAYSFLLHQVRPYYTSLLRSKERDEEGNLYSDLLVMVVIRKARDNFGYKPPNERKPTGKKGKRDVKISQDPEGSAYKKVMSNPLLQAIALSIGDTPEKDKMSNMLMIRRNEGQAAEVRLLWNQGEIERYDGIELADQLENTAITTAQYLLLDMQLEKLHAKLPRVLDENGKKRPVEVINAELMDENCRTVELTLTEYMNERDQQNRTKAKKTVSYAIKSLAYAEAVMDGTSYYLYSAKPQEVKYKKGGIKVVFNADLCKAMLTGRLKTRQSYTPPALRKIKENKHPLGVIIYKWLQTNYERNTLDAGKQHQNANYTLVGTIIENVPELKRRYLREQADKQDYYAKVIRPLKETLDALQNVYKVLDYEILDKNHKHISHAKFTGMKHSEQMQCKIRYVFIDYPNWVTPEGQQLTMHTNKTNSKKK